MWWNDAVFYSTSYFWAELFFGHLIFPQTKKTLSSQSNTQIGITYGRETPGFSFPVQPLTGNSIPIQQEKNWQNVF